jgi:hypothetical protein
MSARVRLPTNRLHLYFDVAFVPSDMDISSEYFDRIRASYYVINSGEPAAACKLLDAVVEGKKAWNITMPTYIIHSHKSDAVDSWKADHSPDLQRLDIHVTLPADVTPCCQQLQDADCGVTALEL